jgi:hypothetical protein
MDFELVGQIRDIQPIVVGRAIRELAVFANAMAAADGEN